MNILILSTHSPNYRAGLGLDVMTALENAGHKVDFICKDASEPLNSSFTCLCKEPIIKRVLRAVLPKGLLRCIKKIRKNKNLKLANDIFSNLIINNGYEIHYLYEDREDDVINKLFKHLKKEYDLVITLWWFSMLTSTTLRRIHDRLKCPIMILSIDMAPMTGGCFYFNNCRNFEKECINCPAMVNLDKDSVIIERPHINYMIKKENYSSINCAFLGNSWMNQYAKASHLFDKAKIFKIGCIIDEQDFCPASSNYVKKKLGIEDKALVLLARSSSEPRKGCNYIIDSISKMWKSMQGEHKLSFILLTVGDDYIYNAMQDLNIPCINYGIVNRMQLVRLYQASTYFLSSSIDDAGPSMVNQSIMCGCPVVCFDNGTAIDVIHNGISGFKSKEISRKGFNEALSDAISFFYTKEYPQIRITSRQIALNSCSRQKFAEDIKNYYEIMIANNP